MTRRPSAPTGCQPAENTPEAKRLNDNPDPAEARRRAAARAAKTEQTAGKPVRTSYIERMKPGYGRPSTPRTRSASHAHAEHAVHRVEGTVSADSSARLGSPAVGKKQGDQSRERQLKRPGTADNKVRATKRTGRTQKKVVVEGSVARSSAVMFLGTFASRILGMVRSPLLLGAVIGMTSPAANSFAVANKLPNLIYMIVVGGIVNAVLVPSIVRATKESDDDGEAFLNKLMTLAIVFLGAITVVLTIGAPFVVKFFAAGMSDQWYSLAVAFAFWCLPQIFFYGLYTVLGQILNARENFGPYTWAPVVNNIVAIAGFAAFLAIYGGYDGPNIERSVWTADKVALLGGVSTLGIACQALVLIWPMRRIGIRYRPDFRWRGSGLGTAGKASWWMMLTMVTSLVPTAVLSNVASATSSRAEAAGLDLSGIAGNQVYDTAYMFYSLPTSLIVVSIATAMFTRLAKSAVDGNMAKMRADTSKTIRMVSTLMLLSASGMIALAVPIIRILGFTVTPPEAITVAKVLVAMCLGLVGVAAVTILDRVYYAFEDTRGAFWVNLPFQIFGIIGYVACAFLPPQWTVVGIGVVMSAANIAAAFVMVNKLSKRMGGMDETRLLVTHVKLLAASSASILLAWISTGIVFGPIFDVMSVIEATGRLILGGLVVVGTYFGAMKLMRMDELAYVASVGRAALRKVGVR